MSGTSKTHYEVLGVARDATQAAIKSAYRKLALRYHPDHDPSQAATEQFLAITSAYEVLGNASRRIEYDRTLQLEVQIQDRKDAGAKAAARQRETRHAQAGRSAGSERVAIEADLQRLRKLFGRSHFREAELLAQSILDRDARQAVAYGVLAEIVRSRGEMERAARYFALALQMDPQNSVYLRKHEETLRLAGVVPESGHRSDRTAGSLISPFVGAGVVAAAISYVVLGKERPIAPDTPLFSTITMGLIVMLLLAGVAVGASLSCGGFLDRVTAKAPAMPERLAPAVALLFVAVCNFWLAMLMYLQSGFQHRSFDFSAGRLVGYTALTTCLFAVGANYGSRIDPLQTLMWGGNVAYLGAVIGWTVADALMD